MNNNLNNIMDKDNNIDKDNITDNKEIIYQEPINNINYVLDPFSVIIKLAILSKKEIGCKIAIYKNVMYINEKGIFQSFVRSLFSSNKIDIQYLYNPIELACKKFLIKNSPIKNLFINAQKGLDNLIETYEKHSIIVHTLYMYYNIIANYLNDNYNDNLFIRDNFSNYYKDDIILKLNSTWTEDRIKIILNMIDFINKDVNSEKSVKCLEEFMIIIDHDTKNIFDSYFQN